MNILYIGHERKLGGASLCLLTMAEEMKKMGHNVYVILPFSRCPVAEELRRAGVKTYGIFFGWWMMPLYWGKGMKFCFRVLYKTEGLAVRRICRRIKQKKIDIVHSNSSTIDVGSRAALKCGVPHVWHFREFGDADYNLAFLKGRAKSVQFIQESQSVCIFISDCLKKYYPELLETDRSEVVYDGVSEDYLNFRTDREERKKVTFLIAGNLQRNKRQDLVLRAVNLLKEEGIQEFQVIIAGGVASTRDSRLYAQKLKEYIDAKRLDNVKMVGYSTNMNQLRQQSDVEIVASTKEAFGRVTVEAMLSGNPVLASDSGANPELIIDGRTGWLFDEGDEEALAQKMKYIIDNACSVRKMGEEAFESARNRFLSSNNTQSLNQIYQELIPHSKQV